MVTVVENSLFLSLETIRTGRVVEISFPTATSRMASLQAAGAMPAEKAVLGQKTPFMDGN